MELNGGYTALFTTIIGYGGIRSTISAPCTTVDLIMAVPIAVFTYCTVKTIGGKCVASLKNLFASNLETKMGEQNG